MRTDRSQRKVALRPRGYAGTVSGRQGCVPTPSDEPLPEQNTDDTDLGWGEPPDDEADEDERLRREKPPHW